ncbi:MAG: hypothetical protein CMM94_01595 [Rickettsiales bacterium]|nr:hypothetical protein [Rickettsiales bacterium]|tara:strand:- start:700 stop:1002 length:303 start_codon:yes stop_codon:yes gene_type:complete
MDMTKKTEGNTLDVTMSGQFTFHDNNSIRGLVNDLEQNSYNELVIHFDHVEFIDSAALGMLLLLKDVTDRKGMKCVLSGAQGQVEKMFNLSKFSALFTLR